MKRDFLKNLDLGNGAHLSDDLVEQIMAEAGKTKTEMQNAITSLTTERDGLQSQLSDANATIQSYKDMDIDGIKQSAADWETKYNTDTQALKDQLESTKYGYAVENAVGSLKFTSESAKKAFLADLTAKKLPIQEGKLLGLEDFAKIDWILIHPPHAGRDNSVIFTVMEFILFQSTLPMRGGTAQVHKIYLETYAHITKQAINRGTYSEAFKVFPHIMAYFAVFFYANLPGNLCLLPLRIIK